MVGLVKSDALTDVSAVKSLLAQATILAKNAMK